MSPTREGDGSRLPRIPEDPNSRTTTRRSLVKEEMSFLDIPVAPRPSLGGPGKPSDGEEGNGFRRELVPELGAYIRLIRSYPL